MCPVVLRCTSMRILENIMYSNHVCECYRQLGNRLTFKISEYFSRSFSVQINSDGSMRLNAPSSASLIPRYILQLGQRGRCCFCANCKIYLELKGADEGLLSFVIVIS